MLTDIEIAQNCKMQPIKNIAADLGIPEEALELYGNYKAKISEGFLNKVSSHKNGKLILVTSVNPTPAGEGKTTTTVGLGQAMSKIGKKAVVCLREPSLGPVFGIKGGAAGGGYSQAVPMEDINLHFTGDMHAITAANNLLCALIDNHIYQGNSLNIDQRRILFKRCLDVNDRALRNVVIGLGGKINGIPREDGFQITVAGEVMAVLCLAEDIADLKNRLGNILVAFSFDGAPIFARDLNAQGAMAVLLKDAIKPNLVQTLEATPVIMHGGPFANIAHGCNSVRATKLGLKLADYCITEAGFGADLGAEKFFDIKCRLSGLRPDAAVIVATARALKYNGGVQKSELNLRNLDALKKGIENLGVHIENIKSFGVPVVVAINKFCDDSDDELEFIKEYCKNKNVDAEISMSFEKGGSGATALAKRVVSACEEENNFKFMYDIDDSVEEKINKIACKIYRASSVEFSPQAKKSLSEIKSLGGDKLPICMAKTQYSLSDNPRLLGNPQGFTVNVRDLKLSNGAGFVVVYLGDIMTMPGLPKLPASNNIDIDGNNKITGLF